MVWNGYNKDIKKIQKQKKLKNQTKPNQTKPNLSKGGTVHQNSKTRLI